MVTRLILRASLLLCCALSLFPSALSQSVTVSPTSISFGNQAQGTSSSVHKATLKNGQSSPITISGISTNLTDFSQTNNCPMSPVTLKAGASCMISVTFTPSTQGAENGTLTMVDTGLSSPQLVTLTGTGTAPILQSIAVTPNTASVIVANTQAFTATGNYSDGSTQNLTTTASWTSSSTSIATIGLHTGLAKGVSAGTSTMTATLGKVSGSATLTVTAAILTSISVTPSTAPVAAGKTQQYKATGTYNNGTTQNLTNTATWSSSATSIATVSGGGLATTVAQGTTTISATSGTISGSATLTVTAAVLASLAVTPGTVSVAAGNTQQFTATGIYTDGTTKDLTTAASWTSSATSVATIKTHTGLATTLATGTTTITATLGTLHGSATLTVTAAALTSIAVTPSNPSIAAGYTQQFTATGTYSDGTTQDLTASASWTSSNAPVASVATGGLSTAVAQGTATITATSGAISGSATLTVTSTILTSISISLANPSIANGTNQQFAATGTYSDGSTQDVTSTATWSSSLTSVASITASGLATGMGVGTATITASVGSITGSTTITVTTAALISIAVTPAIPTVPLGTTQQFTATGTFNNGTTQNITGTVQWSSDTPTVATISNNAATAGLATGVAQGTATISATSGSVTGSTTLTVTAAALVSIAIMPVAPSIALGTTQQFTATGTYTDGSTQDLTSIATWSSDTPTTATISNAGLATSVAQGTATISASSGSVRDSTLLTVTAATLVSIAINPPTATIAQGTTQQFTARGTFTDGTTQDLTQSGHWSSTAAAIATISNAAGTAGLATSLATGTTTINIASGSISGTATLVVNPAALVSIAISPQAPSIALGYSQQFTATGTYNDNSTQDLTTVVTWSSSSASIAVVSNTAGSNGLATSSGVGTATITATSGSISSSTTLAVTSAHLVSITVTPAGATLAIGGALQYAATGTYSDNSTQDLTTSATWSSSNPAVAAISNNAGTQGLATGVALGGVTITAMSGSISGTTTLTVAGATLVSITVTPASASVVVALTQQFSATGTYSDGTTQDLTASATWTSSAPTIATIAGTGLATGVAAGSATITASSSAITGSTTLTVTAATLVSLSVSPSVITVTQGGTQQFTATGAYNNGTTQDLTNSGTWSSKGGAATITATGTATAAALGSATITASSAGITGTAIFISILAGAPAAFPFNINFAPQPTGTISSFPQTATVYNLGSSSATITALSISNLNFQLTGGTVPITLAAGASANFTFSFTPSKTGNVAGSATFSFDKAAKQIVQLNGMGASTTAAALLSGNSLAFGNQPLGISSAPQTVTITNGGTTSLTIQAVTVTPPFFQTGFVNSVRLSGGASFSFQVNYMPSVLGANRGAILLTYDVLPNQGITLSGTATAATTLGITTFPTLPGATQNAAYQATLTAAGGVGQITWSLALGSSLPSGLSLSTSGIISGTLSSSTPGTYSFVAQVTDSNNPPSTASTVLTLPVGSPTGAACNNISWDVAGTTTPLVPIIDLGTGHYGAYQGGLYANGSNQDDPNHHAYGVTEAGAVQPLDSNGNPSPTGKYALLTIGNSNASTISSEFVSLASSDPAKNPSLVVVNGATGSASADALQDPGSYFWGIITNDYLPNAGVTSNQVEVVWLNDVDVSHPPTIPNLQAMLENIARLLVPKFPNVKLLYLSSMNYTGYSNGIDSFQPEPPAYETGFAAKQVIQDQINGTGNLNYNPANGAVVAPWAAWSAYYWTNGLMGRSDGLTWSCQDANPDGAHPDPSGQLKAAAQILSFFKSDATGTPWFLIH